MAKPNMQRFTESRFVKSAQSKLSESQSKFAESKFMKSVGEPVSDFTRKKTAQFTAAGDFDTSLGGRMKRPKNEKKDPKAGRGSAWEQRQRQRIEDSPAYRNVHDTQQLDRAKETTVRGPLLPNTLATLVGVITLILAWIVWGVGGFLLAMVVGDGGMEDSPTAPTVTRAEELGVSPYVHHSTIPWGNAITRDCYQLIEVEGAGPVGECMDKPGQVPRPQWHIDATVTAMQNAGMPVDIQQEDEQDNSLSAWLLFSHISLIRVVVTGLVALGVGSLVHTVLMRQLDAQNELRNTTDINPYENDQYIQLPNEVIRRFTIFPDVGAHSPVQASSLISHVMLSNKGVNKIKVPKRATGDIVDDHGNLITAKGEILRDSQGNPIMELKEVFDTDFAHDLYEASAVPNIKTLRGFFDPRDIPHNPDGADRDKTGKQDTLAQHINEEWTMPITETQRPAGAYIVDEAPVNTMVLAITRGGKGQTYIEPMIDIWLREKVANNMVVNDPKGELLVKHFYRASIRGYQVVQFNLINPTKTDVYNPLGLAAEAAREGNSTKCAQYVENIAEVFFPMDNADDPVWPSAANNAFKRAAYGLIDYYLEEERQLRKRAAQVKMDPKVLETRIDNLWGKVTLFNCYQLFVQLSSKKIKSPMTRFNADLKAGKFGDFEHDSDKQREKDEAEAVAQQEEIVWEGNEELDALTLFFNATALMPKNSMRGLVANADRSLRSMGAAEKMLASVYGIAITAMSFFTDPTIARLTSGTPSQNTDLAGFSFPRRFGVRFDQNYVRYRSLIGLQVRWDAFTDATFTTPLPGGDDFVHDDTISDEGWARAYFRGIFPEDTAYVRLQLFNPGNRTLVKTFYFRFLKLYQTNLSGRTYVKDPVTGKKIVRNGVLIELRKNDKGRFVPGDTMFPAQRLDLANMVRDGHLVVNPDDVKSVKSHAKAISQTQVRYSEQPKALFLVTPPHLMKYAKLILIAVKQLVDLNFDQSYMTKSSQKPLYKTRFMLDELGNLQSEGHGIANFQTMLSIGLGQEQQFTLILQTLQQLRDVYGESVDKIVQGNAQPLSAPIATPTGWVSMGKIRPGDEVLTPAGVATVSGFYPHGERDVYAIEMADGSSAQASEDHLWEIWIDDDDLEQATEILARTA